MAKEVDLVVEDTQVELFAKQAEKIRPALTEIGVFLLSQTQKAFRAQSFDGKPWAPRMVPNIPGIVGDLNKGQQPKARRFQPRPALVDTGRLRQSFNFLVGKDSVQVGTKVKYGALQQSGGKSRITLTKVGREGLKKFLKKRPELRLGWLFRKPSFEVNVRPRRMVGISDSDVSEILDILKDHFLEG